MPCYFPLEAYKGKSEDAQKIKIVFKRPESWRGERLALPCGRCIGCRLERSRQWAIRCMHEASLYEENSFITLTYDDEHLPVGDEVCHRCVGSHVVGGSLCVGDFQDFMKRLRKSESGKRIRYYHCGEYGEQFGRPHYHALLFGHGFADREFFKGSGENRLYVSEELRRLWPFGHSLVGNVTFESAAYVARYVMKKVTGEPAEAYYGSRRPDYCTMSRRPGIGARWFEKFKADVYPRDGVVVRGRVTRAPRFYDGLLAREDPALLAWLKIDREKNEKFVTDVYLGKEIVESDSSSRRLRVKHEVKLAEISRLKRPLDGGMYGS